MDILLYLFGAIAALLFLTSAYQLRKQISTKVAPINSPISELALDQLLAVQSADPAYDKMAERYNGKIALYTDLTERYRKINFGLSFAVTTLSAAATLTTAINIALAKSPPTANPKIAIIVAAITFISTLTNFVATHYSVLRTEGLKDVMEWTGKQARFYAEYDAAPTPERREQVIAQHQRDFRDN